MATNLVPASMLIAIMLCQLATIAHAENGAGAVPTADDLTKSVFRVSADPGRFESFSASGTLSVGARNRAYRFRLFWRKPSQYWMLFEDAADETPLMLFVNGKAIFYDPTSGITFADDAAGQFVVRAAEGRLQLKFGAADRPDFDLDFPSLIGTAKNQRQVAAGPGGGYSLTGHTENGNSIRALINRDLPCPLVALDLFNVRLSDKFPMLRIDSVMVNEAYKEDNFRFPERKDLAPLGNADPAKAEGEGWQRIGASLLIRDGIRHPEDRPDVEHTLGAIDWDKARSLDGTLAPRLRQCVQQYTPRPAGSGSH